MSQAIGHRRLAVVTLTLVLVSSVQALGQYAQRSALVGTVTDATGGAIGGASVVLTGASLIGGTRTATTTPTGQYQFMVLLPGVYSVSVSAAGFEGATRSGIELPVETTYTIDVTLALSHFTEQVKVDVEAPLVDVTTSAAPDHFGRPLLQNLPTGRTLASVLNLASGVTDDVAYGGAQRTSNAASIDGVRVAQPSTGESWVPTGYNWLEAVQVVALGAPAEYNQFTGAIVDGVLRSGSNQVRGLAEYVAALPEWTGDNTTSLPEKLQSVFVSMKYLSWWDANTQVGGPLRRDRLWLFGGASVIRRRYREFGYAGPHATGGYEPRGVLKLDASPAALWTLQGFYQYGATNMDGIELGPGVLSPEASADLRGHDHVWSARTHWTGARRTLVELRAGGNVSRSRNEPHAPSTRSGPPARWDVVTGVTADNTWLWIDSRRTSVAAAATVSHHTDVGIGSHALRAGVEVERRGNIGSAGYPGGMNIYEENGVPVSAEMWAGGTDSPTTHRYSAFVQDRWTLGRVTLEPGLRLETNRGAVPGRGTVMVTSPVAPRLGLAWMATSDGRTVVRAHYGRYHDALFNTFYEGLDTTHDSPRITAVPTGPDSWEEISRTSNAPASAIDSGVKQARVDQWLVGAERQLLADLAIEARLVRRRFDNFIGDIDPRLDEWTPFAVADPGPDGRPGTTDDGPALTAYRPYAGQRELVIGNPAGAERDHHAVQLIARKRFSHRWQGQASYTWSRSKGLNNQANVNTGFWGMSPGGIGANPNYSGPSLGEDRPVFDYSEFKALGTWQAPWLGGFGVSGVYRWHTGVRWQRKVTVTRPIFLFLDAEPIGARKGQASGIVDLRLEKRWPLGSNHRTIGVYLDVFNVTNTGVATRTVQMSGPRFGQPAGWTEPRIFRAGGRVAF